MRRLFKHALTKVLPFLVRYLTGNGESAAYRPTPPAQHFQPNSSVRPEVSKDEREVFKRLGANRAAPGLAGKRNDPAPRGGQGVAATNATSARRLSENSILSDLAIVNSTTYEAKKAE
jgi:hypothetical protein